MSDKRKTCLTMGGIASIAIGVEALTNLTPGVDILDVVWVAIATAWIWNGIDLLRWRWELRHD